MRELEGQALLVLHTCHARKEKETPLGGGVPYRSGGSAWASDRNVASPSYCQMTIMRARMGYAPEIRSCSVASRVFLLSLLRGQASGTGSMPGRDFGDMGKASGCA